MRYRFQTNTTHTTITQHIHILFSWMPALWDGWLVRFICVLLIHSTPICLHVVLLFLIHLVECISSWNELNCCVCWWQTIKNCAMLGAIFFFALSCYGIGEKCSTDILESKARWCEIIPPWLTHLSYLSVHWTKWNAKTNAMDKWITLEEVRANGFNGFALRRCSGT